MGWSCLDKGNQSSGPPTTAKEGGGKGKSKDGNQTTPKRRASAIRRSVHASPMLYRWRGILKNPSDPNVFLPHKMGLLNFPLRWLVGHSGPIVAAFGLTGGKGPQGSGQGTAPGDFWVCLMAIDISILNGSDLRFPRTRHHILGGVNQSEGIRPKEYVSPFHVTPGGPGPCFCTQKGGGDFRLEN